MSTLVFVSSIFKTYFAIAFLDAITISCDFFSFIHPDMFLLYFQFLSSKIQTGFNSDFGYVRCKKLTSARKQMFILRAPKVLVIQLKVIDPQSFMLFCFGEKLVLFFEYG